MTDIVERLRGAAAKPNGWAILGADAATEAAAEIESLRSRLALRELERDTARELLKDKKARLAEAISHLRKVMDLSIEGITPEDSQVLLEADEFLHIAAAGGREP